MFGQRLQWFWKSQHWGLPNVSNSSYNLKINILCVFYCTASSFSFFQEHHWKKINAIFHFINQLIFLDLPQTKTDIKQNLNTTEFANSWPHDLVLANDSWCIWCFSSKGWGLVIVCWITAFCVEHNVFQLGILLFFKIDKIIT